MDDDEFGADADFLAALAASEVGKTANNSTTSAARQAPPQRPPQGQPQTAQQRPPPTTARIQQPTPQRIPRPGGSGSGSAAPGQPRIVQPTPQALPGGIGSGDGSGSAPRAAVPGSGASILVSPRQKGNPLLAQLRTVPWEYSDVLADYVLGATTCALFLSLKYHRLHPEYIFARFRGLQGRYRLRVLLAMVDIDNHEEPLRELAKTSLVNQVTLVLCWSAAEAARYLTLYKTFEHATGFSAIRGQQGGGSGASYAERLVQFATVPRAVHKADAVALVSAFGSLRRAVAADPEQLGLVQGWGERKVQAWRRAVGAPFRVQKGARRKGQTMKKKAGGGDDDEIDDDDGDAVFNSKLDRAIPIGRVPLRDMPGLVGSREGEGEASAALQVVVGEPSAPEATTTTEGIPARRPEEPLAGGVAAALARLREKG